MTTKTSQQIRQEFLDFFSERGHTVVPGAPLLPDDPTLLFTNAGMVQFKDVFLGTGTRPYARAVDAQKCLRVSGKHNDLDAVGHDTYHHTLFEMLGNWSFGDYFKREAIRWAWELLVEQWGMDPGRLYATVFEGDPQRNLEADEEAAGFWKSETSIAHDHVLAFDSKDNFWTMGETGPCGPCSEIHIDLRPDTERQAVPGATLVNQDHPRVMEIWNLVFIQYNMATDGSLQPLEQKHVDTGMGFERIVAVLQGKASNYETDLFGPIMERVRQLSGHTTSEMEVDPVPYRVLADHGRTLACLLAEGLVPGNEKQSYVLRMVMRRALRYGKKLGFSKPFLADVGEAVVEHLGGVFPELRENRKTILNWAAQEEKLFTKTLDRGLAQFEHHVEQLKARNETTISGSFAFFLHDTHGFPIEVTEDVAREQGLSVDLDGFRRQMDEQKARSRANVLRVTSSAKASHDVEVDNTPTEALHYDAFVTEVDAVLIALVDDSTPSKASDKASAQWMRFDRTPFYAEGGGQVCDQGQVINTSRHGKARVLAVTKTKDNVYLHRVRIEEGAFEAGDRCTPCIDVERRKATQRNHTATHILHAALHRVLGEHAKQAGSYVSPDELRFDFSHFEALKPDEIERVEHIANRAILDNLVVQLSQETLESAKGKGAMALFAEDYKDPQNVRMVSILEADGSAFSRELCGGTHVGRTGEIGGFKIVSEESVSAGVRRVKAATGFNLLQHLNEREACLTQAAKLLNTVSSELLVRLKALLEEHGHLNQRVRQLRVQQVSSRLEHYLDLATRYTDAAVVVAQTAFSGDDLKQLCDALEQKLNPGVVLLGSTDGGRVQLVCKVSKPLTQRVKAGEVIKALTAIVGGGGGGAPHFAQGGGSQPDQLSQALDRGKALLESALA